jgi:hypothetical protein
MRFPYLPVTKYTADPILYPLPRLESFLVGLQNFFVDLLTTQKILRALETGHVIITAQHFAVNHKAHYIPINITIRIFVVPENKKIICTIASIKFFQTKDIGRPLSRASLRVKIKDLLMRSRFMD